MLFDESHMYGLEGDISYLPRSILQYWIKKPKLVILALLPLS